MSFVDPRPAWDAKEAELDRVEADLESYAKVAKSTGDAAAITAATDRLHDFKSARAAYREVRGRLDEAASKRDAAVAKFEKARADISRGTLDEKEALKRHQALIVAEAAVMFLGEMSALYAGVDGTRQRVAQAITGPEASVIDETRKILTGLFEYSRPEVAADMAEETGRRSTAVTAVWWPVAEALARAEFPKHLAKAKASRDPNLPGTPTFDHRRETIEFANLDDLEACFARRRAGFDRERQRVAGQLQALTGQLATLGGAS